MADWELALPRHLHKFIIDEASPLIEALKRIDEGGHGVLFVERNGVLVATLTDGDVRRFILANGNLHASVRDVANYHPKSLLVARRKEAVDYVRMNVIDGVPLLDEEGHILDIVFARELLGSKDMQHSLKAPVVMMAGGKGTRLYPYTKILPKPLIPIGEIPIAEHIINGFYDFGCRDFYLIVNYKKNMLKAYFNELNRDYNIYFVDEDEPLGTGGGISLLKGMLHETFFFTNCDILIQDDFEKIFRHHKENKALITMVCSLKNFQIPYGVVHLNTEGELASMTEKPNVPFLTNTGCYIVEPEVIGMVPANTSMGFPDIMQTCQQRGGKVGVFPISEDAWLDMGVPEELEKMRERLGV